MNAEFQKIWNNAVEALDEEMNIHPLLYDGNTLMVIERAMEIVYAQGIEDGKALARHEMLKGFVDDNEKANMKYAERNNLGSDWPKKQIDSTNNT